MSIEIHNTFQESSIGDLASKTNDEGGDRASDDGDIAEIETDSRAKSHAEVGVGE